MRLAGEWTRLMQAEWLRRYQARTREQLAEMPLSVARDGTSASTTGAAIEGPHRLTVLERIVWRWRVWRADRMWPRGVQR